MELAHSPSLHPLQHMHVHTRTRAHACTHLSSDALGQPPWLGLIYTEAMAQFAPSPLAPGVEGAAGGDCSGVLSPHGHPPDVER